MRGPLRSRPPQEILESCRRSVQQGYHAIRLVATDSGCYGRDCGSSLAELLCLIAELPGLSRLIVDDINIAWAVRDRAFFVAAAFCRVDFLGPRILGQIHDPENVLNYLKESA